MTPALRTLANIGIGGALLAVFTVIGATSNPIPFALLWALWLVIAIVAGVQAFRQRHR